MNGSKRLTFKDLKAPDGNIDWNKIFSSEMESLYNQCLQILVSKNILSAEINSRYVLVFENRTDYLSLKDGTPLYFVTIQDALHFIKTQFAKYQSVFIIFAKKVSTPT